MPLEAVGPEPASGRRPLRRDAAQNRMAIVCAAGRLFADRGAGISLQDVAEAAGVGIATVYRRFPTRGALVEAVVAERMARYADEAERLALRAEDEPWEAFRDYVLLALEQQAADRAFAAVLAAPIGTVSVCREQLGRVFRASVVIVDRAKAAGAIRPGFDHSDLYLLTLAGDGLFRGAGDATAGAWRRLAAYLLDAFRAQPAEPLPPVPLAWARLTRIPTAEAAGGAA